MLPLPPLLRRRPLCLTFACIGLPLLCLVLLGAPATSAAGQRVPQQTDLHTPTAAPDAPVRSAGAGVLTIHVVEEGDTLWGIAIRYDVTVEALIAANQLDDPDLMQLGQELIISSPDFEPPTAAKEVVTETARPTPKPTGEVTRQPAGPAAGTPTAPALLTPSARPQPAAAGPSSLRSACPSNVKTYDLALPGDPIYLLLAGDWLYVIANGDLYRLSAAALAAGEPPQIENITPAGRKVGQYEIRELVYAALDPAGGDLLLLDKSDDVFRYTAAGEWSLPFPATQVPDQFPDPQFLAVQPPAAAPRGAAFVLDADLSTVWQLLPGSGLPRPYWAHNRLLDALDMHTTVAENGGTIFTLLIRDGSVTRWAEGDYTTLYRPDPPRGRQPWLSHLLALEDALAIVDAQERTLTTLDPQTGEVLWRIDFRLPGMQRLRSAAMYGDTLFAVAGRSLYMADLAGGETCTPAAFDDGLYYQGQDLQALLPALQPPFPGVIMPERPRSYPGARRLYRNGIHEGVDLYGTDAPGVGMGSSVNAIAAGAVNRADAGYVEMLPAEYEGAIARSFAEHRTPPDLTDAFLGRQVHILHGPGVESRYGHLSAVAAGITPDVIVEQGETVGKVGVSGTSAGAYGTTDGVHLHYEIWIDGRYLGQGVSLYETMRLWQVLFGANS